MPATWAHSSTRFRLKSSSTIASRWASIRIRSCSHSSRAPRSPDGQACATTPLMHRPSSSTMRRACSAANCVRIRSKPTSSTVLPLITIFVSSLSSPVAESFSVEEAYLALSASRKLRGRSYGLDGRIKEPALRCCDWPGWYALVRFVFYHYFSWILVMATHS